MTAHASRSDQYTHPTDMSYGLWLVYHLFSVDVIFRPHTVKYQLYLVQYTEEQKERESTEGPYQLKPRINLQNQGFMRP